jgi:threonine aldolase
MINLISDTITKPTKGMLNAMMQAEVGDDVFGEDPTVNRLEAIVAEMFSKEAALFCPSGTMTNQIAIKCHTRPLDEMICDITSHVYQYETAGYAFHSGIGVNLIHGEYGKINAQQIEEKIKDDFDWLPNTRLVVLENTCNRGGGTYYTLEEIKPIKDLCKARGLKLHLDGARIFNALVETGESTKDVGNMFDSISVCLSKGLGAPVGSVLIGDREFIKQARKTRKVMGGGMRQAGFLAAAGIYALENNITRLKEDHIRAKIISKLLAEKSYVTGIFPVKTNIIIFELEDRLPAAKYIEILRSHGINASAFGKNMVRFVFHLDINEEMFGELVRKLEGMEVF